MKSYYNNMTSVCQCGVRHYYYFIHARMKCDVLIIKPVCVCVKTVCVCVCKLCVCVFVCVTQRSVCALVCIWKSEDNFGALFLFLLSSPPRDWTQVSKLAQQLPIPAEPSYHPHLNLSMSIIIKNKRRIWMIYLPKRKLNPSSKKNK